MIWEACFCFVLIFLFLSLLIMDHLGSLFLFCFEDIPEGLVAQLKVGGSLFVTIGPEWRAQEFEKHVKINETYLECHWLRQVWTAPIIEKYRQLRRYKNGKTIFYGYTTVQDPLYTPLHGRK
uniref:Uncharacterized protein n=1 Tax=Cacopsylla melanoneura TaxID=428564 RepID=A0A8D9A774_9HEMI